MTRFVPEYHPRKLTHDEEKGLTADINTEYLKERKCALFIVQEQLHSTLGIIDRFIRTLRDMNRPVERPVTDESTDHQFTYISRDKMRKILDSYNNTVHSSTGLTPKQMMDHPELEDQYIQRRLDQQINQYAIKDFKLDIGTKVRYLLPRNAFEKKRYNVSRETYTVKDRLGNMYTIMAQDGNTMTLPRWRLIKSDDTKHMGQSLGSDKAFIEEVISRAGPRTVRVRFHRPDGTNEVRVINARELRMPYPQMKTKYET